MVDVGVWEVSLGCEDDGELTSRVSLTVAGANGSVVAAAGCESIPVKCEDAVLIAVGLVLSLNVEDVGTR
jgi:hypothetical protein